MINYDESYLITNKCYSFLVEFLFSQLSIFLQDPKNLFGNNARCFKCILHSQVLSQSSFKKSISFTYLHKDHLHYRDDNQRE